MVAQYIFTEDIELSIERHIFPRKLKNGLVYFEIYSRRDK